jgi:hypothetical protein
MNRKTSFALLAVFLGASLIAFASGKVNSVGVIDTSGLQSYLAAVADIDMVGMQAETGVGASSAPMSQAAPAAVPYFPMQHALKAAPGASEAMSTF